MSNALHKSKKFSYSKLLGLIIPFFLLISLSFIYPVKAELDTDAFNLTDWDINFSEAMGFSDNGFVGGMFLSAILMCMLILPTAMITRKQGYGIYPELAMTILGIVLCVGLGWLHYWILLVTGLLIALLFAFSMRGLLSGGD